MTTHSDTSLVPATDREHPAWSRFLNAFSGKAFSPEATHQAWSWFKAGWDAHVGLMQAVATDWWCNNGDKL